jgi:hypothetical protein
VAVRCVALQGRFSSQEQFKVLHERYPLVNNSTKGLLLSTYLKMLLSDPSNSGLQADVSAVFNKCSHQMDPDLQQRSAEYLVRIMLLRGCGVGTVLGLHHGCRLSTRCMLCSAPAVHSQSCQVGPDQQAHADCACCAASAAGAGPEPQGNCSALRAADAQVASAGVCAAEASCSECLAQRFTAAVVYGCTTCRPRLLL